MTHVAIDSRVARGISGGVAQVLIGFAQGFASADLGDLKRTWILSRESNDWLSGHLPEGDDRIVVRSLLDEAGASVARKAPNVVSAARPHVERLRISSMFRSSAVSAMDRELERRGVDVVHLPFQEGLATALPTVYHPHDLQQIHFPELFTKAQIARRETVWRSKALAASAVSVGTAAVAEDVHRHWGVERGKIFIVPLAAVHRDGGRDLGSVNHEKAADSASHILYPAAFWPHKNHETLVRAVGLLRSSGLAVNLRLPGSPVGNFATVKDLAVKVGLDARDVFPGYVSDSALAAMFDAADLVAVPSLFEAASFPIWEAFARSKPVVAARSTSLPQQVRDGGLVVEPTDHVAFAEAMAALLQDPHLRAEMGARGHSWAAKFTWRRTAMATAALYRRAAGHAPKAQEEAALTTGPVL